MKAIPRTALWQTMGTNAFYHHKTVLLTGAAGSIGSQLVRTLLDANPRGVILTDNNEGAGGPNFNLLRGTCSRRCRLT
jgi:FlaA1/EpsC-like NDP-sugar epimerase